MEFEILKALVSRIHGATFASLDTVTRCGSNKCLRKVSNNERVILFRTNGGSGYENRVKRFLTEAGKNPEGFIVGPLPWGERIDNLPLITCNGNYYLQTIQLSPGETKYYLGITDTVVSDPSIFGVRSRGVSKQDLPVSSQVIVNTYDIRNIKRIALFGQNVFDTNISETGTRSILKLNYGD